MAELAMLADRRLNRKVVIHPASSLAQDRESSPAETSILTTMLRRQLWELSRGRCSAFITSERVRRQKAIAYKTYLHTY